MAAVDMFLKLLDIKGESIDTNHEGEIDIESFSFGMSNSGSASVSGGGGTGKVSFQDIHFTKRMDKSSPTLMLACCTGKHIREAFLTARKAGGAQEVPFEFLKVKFTDILVSSFKTATPGHNDVTDRDAGRVPDDNQPTESLSLNFAKITWTYSYQNADGTTGKSSFGWDLKANTKI